MSKHQFQTKIWREEVEENDPFAAQRSWCYGYEVAHDLVRALSFSEMLYLLFLGTLPRKSQLRLLDALLVFLAHPGIRHPMVHAAMCGGAPGSTSAGSLIAALEVASGACGGSRELVLFMRALATNRHNMRAWKAYVRAGVWDTDPAFIHPDHCPGFKPHGVALSGYDHSVIDSLAASGGGTHLRWLAKQKSMLGEIAGVPIGPIAIAGCAFADLGVTTMQAEMLFLIACLPGAAVHAIEARENGWRLLPFFENTYSGLEVRHDSV